MAARTLPMLREGNCMFSGERIQDPLFRRAEQAIRESQDLIDRARENLIRARITGTRLRLYLAGRRENDAARHYLPSEAAPSASNGQN